MYSRHLQLAERNHVKHLKGVVQALSVFHSEAIVMQTFWHLDTRPSISFPSFFNCVFVHGIVILFSPLYFMHWVRCITILRQYEGDCLFELWTNVHDAFIYVFQECLGLIGVSWPTSWHESQVSPLRWRQNGRDSVSNHQPRHCLRSLLFGRRSRKTSKLRVTGLCVGNSPGPVNSPHKGPVTRKMFPFDDVIMQCSRSPAAEPPNLAESWQLFYCIFPWYLVSTLNSRLVWSSHTLGFSIIQDVHHDLSDCMK